MIKIILSYPHDLIDKPGTHYKVQQVDQSTAFKPGQYLTEDEVGELCAHPGMYSVSSRPNKKD